MKKYKQLKDLPETKAGAVWKWEELLKGYKYYDGVKTWMKAPQNIEPYSDWFEEVKEAKKESERIKVNELMGHEITADGRIYYKFRTTDCIPANQFSFVSSILEWAINFKSEEAVG